MTRAVCTLALTIFAVGQIAHAGKDSMDVGEQVKHFTLKVVNADDVGRAYVGIDEYVGDNPKEPKQAALLSFFATYCEPCKREMPYLAALYDLYKDKGLVILSISIDKDPEPINEVGELAKKHNVKYPVLSDRFNIVAKRYFISKLPCMYLVDGDGKVAMVKVGYDDDVSKDLLDNIRTALGQPLSDPVPEVLVPFMHGNDPAAATVDVPEEPGEEGAQAEGDASKDEAKNTEGADQEKTSSDKTGDNKAEGNMDDKKADKPVMKKSLKKAKKRGYRHGKRKKRIR